MFGQKGFRRPSVDAQSQKAKRQLIAATTLCFIFMIAELVGGCAAGSLAIITDAAHLLSDCISFIVALIAIKLSKRPADNKMSFGYKRAEVFGAVISVIGIWLLTAFLVYLALLRLYRGDFEIDADTMLVVSSIGVFINIIMGVVLHGSCFSLPHGHSHGGGTTSHHNHSHSHINRQLHSHDGSLNNNTQSHNGHTNSNGTTAYLSPELNGRSYNLNRNNSISNALNLSSLNTSRGQSRHNSFNKMLNNKNLEEHRASVDLLRTRIDEPPLIHRMSIDGGLTRITVDNRSSFSHSRLVDDSTSLQLTGVQPLQPHHHRGSVDSTHSSSEDSGGRGSEEKQNINIRAAVIHVIGDFIQSIGVFVAALVIKMNVSYSILRNIHVI